MLKCVCGALRTAGASRILIVILGFMSWLHAAAPLHAEGPSPEDIVIPASGACPRDLDKLLGAENNATFGLGFTFATYPNIPVYRDWRPRSELLPALDESFQKLVLYGI